MSTKEENQRTRTGRNYGRVPNGWDVLEDYFDSENKSQQRERCIECCNYRYTSWENYTDEEDCPVCGRRRRAYY